MLWERRWGVGGGEVRRRDLASVTATVGAFLRSLTSQKRVHPSAQGAPGEFPRKPSSLRRGRPTRRSPPARGSGKPWEPPGLEALSGNPLSRRVAGKQRLRSLTTDTPPQRRVGDPSVELEGWLKNEAPEISLDIATVCKSAF